VRRKSRWSWLTTGGVLLALGVVGAWFWGTRILPAAQLRRDFLQAAAQTGKDTVVFADWITAEGSLRAVDFMRGRSGVLYSPAPSEVISAASTSPISPWCAFLSAEEDAQRERTFRRLKLLDMRSLRITHQTSLPDHLYAYDQPPAWSHDGERLAVACVSNQGGPEVVVFRPTTEALLVESRVPIPRKAAGPQPFLHWGADASTVYVSVGSGGKGARSYVVDLLTEETMPAPYPGQIVDTDPHGYLLTWLPDRGYMVADPGSGTTREIGWPLGIGHRLWDQGRYLLRYGGYEGVFSVDRPRFGPVPEQVLVYDTRRRLDAGLVDLWCGPPPAHLSVTCSTWVGGEAAGFKWLPWPPNVD